MQNCPGWHKKLKSSFPLHQSLFVELSCQTMPAEEAPAARACLRAWHSPWLRPDAAMQIRLGPGVPNLLVCPVRASLKTTHCKERAFWKCSSGIQRAESNAFVVSTKSGILCSIAFSCSWRMAKIMSTVLRLLWKPHWLSRSTSSDMHCRRDRMILARLLPLMDSNKIPWWCQQMRQSPLRLRYW